MHLRSCWVTLLYILKAVCFTGGEKYGVMSPPGMACCSSGSGDGGIGVGGSGGGV